MSPRMFASAAARASWTSGPTPRPRLSTTPSSTPVSGLNFNSGKPTRPDSTWSTSFCTPCRRWSFGGFSFVWAFRVPGSRRRFSPSTRSIWNPWPGSRREKTSSRCSCRCSQRRNSCAGRGWGREVHPGDGSRWLSPFFASSAPFSVRQSLLPFPPFSF